MPGFPVGLAGAGSIFLAGIAQADFAPQKNLPFGGSPFDPSAVAVDHSHNVYVTDNGGTGGGGRVLELVRSGNGFKPQKQLLFGGLSTNLSGVAVDEDGNVYVADPTNHNVKELPHGSSVQKTLPFGGSPFVPAGVAVDFRGNVYVTDQNTGGTNGRVLELHRSGDGFTPQQQLAFTGLSQQISGLAIDGLGNVYVADPTTNSVQELVIASNTQRTLPFGGSPFVPTGVALRFGDVHVSDNNTGGSSGRALKLDKTGATTFEPQEQLPFGGLSFNLPGIAVDEDGSVYLVDADNHRVVWLHNNN